MNHKKITHILKKQLRYAKKHGINVNVNVFINTGKKGFAGIKIKVHNNGQISGKRGENATQGGQIAHTGGQNANQNGHIKKRSK